MTAPPAPAGAPWAVEVRDAVVRYAGVPVLDSVSLRIPESAILAIVGPNGGGKTTLLKLMVGLLEPDSGSVSILGGPARAHDPSLVGYVPQIKRLDRRFPALAAELVASGLNGRWPWRLSAADRARAQEALEAAGAGGLGGRALGTLSGGQLQRVYLARGIIRRPRLLLLDEPATGVDTPGQAEFLQVLESHRKATGCTIVLVTHDWTAARWHATHVGLLNRRLTAFGTPEEAMSADGLASAFGHSAHAHPMTVSRPRP